jgi:hypothetical protein
MIVKQFFIMIGLVFLAQLVIWFQLNGQFIWQSFNKYTWALAILGVPISYILIKATKAGYLAFNGILWPQRLICFATGIIIFSILTWIFMDEGISTKTMICLILSVTIVLIQVLWN